MIHDKIQQAINLNYISKPSQFPLPKKMPLFASVAAITLPDGCSALDNRLGYRISTGTGWSQAEADFIACVEAIERFSIQHADNSPVFFKSFASINGQKTFKAEELLIGVRGDPYSVTDKGCAAGPTVEFASTKAVLEVLEHHYNDQVSSGKLEMFALVKNLPPQVQKLSKWLTGQLRKLDIQISTHRKAYWFAMCACSDFDGGRRTESCGVGLTKDEAVCSAVKESVLFWRNMVEMEKQGTSLEVLNTRERSALLKYRGASNFSICNSTSHVFVNNKNSCNSIDTCALLQIASEECAQKLFLIDLTHPKLGLPVVRCHAGY